MKPTPYTYAGECWNCHRYSPWEHDKENSAYQVSKDMKHYGNGLNRLGLCSECHKKAMEKEEGDAK